MDLALLAPPQAQALAQPQPRIERSAAHVWPLAFAEEARSRVDRDTRRARPQPVVKVAEDVNEGGRQVAQPRESVGCNKDDVAADGVDRNRRCARLGDCEAQRPPGVGAPLPAVAGLVRTGTARAARHDYRAARCRQRRGLAHQSAERAGFKDHVVVEPQVVVKRTRRRGAFPRQAHAAIPEQGSVAGNDVSVGPCGAHSGGGPVARPVINHEQRDIQIAVLRAQAFQAAHGQRAAVAARNQSD